MPHDGWHPHEHDEQGRHPLRRMVLAAATFLPFGGGPRVCIGLSFALAEAQIVLACLLMRYKIGLTKSEPVLPVGRVTIQPSYEPAFRLERG